MSADYSAAAFDGAATAPLVDGIPLPEGTTLVPLADREAEGVDRWGRIHQLGAARWAVGAVLPPGSLRLRHPAYTADGTGAPLAPRAYVAIGARAGGELVAAATPTDADPAHAPPTGPAELQARVVAMMRERPSNRLLRQLARCARDYGCVGARNAFLGRWECALPLAAPANERPPEAIAPMVSVEATPTEPAAFRPDATEIADVVLAHFAAGGTMASFGRACDGEPLLAARLVEDVARRVRAAARAGTLRLETNGSQPAALRRVVEAGVDAITVRLASARAETYETLHGPVGHRWSDVRATLRECAALGVALDVALLVLPGITDRPAEIDAIVAVLRELPAGTLQLRDLACDPRRAAALVPGEPPAGVPELVRRLRAEAPHFRLAAFARPLAAA